MTTPAVAHPPNACRLAATLALLAAAALAGCATAGRGGVLDAGVPLVAVPHLEERALLLLMVDRQRFEPVVVAQAMRLPDAALREAAAATLGRVGDPAGASYLEELLADDDPTVRRAAAFALGELDFERLEPTPLGEGGAAGPEREAAARSLALAAADADRETGLLAVEALGKLGVAVAAVTPALGDLPEAERWARLLPSLFRFAEPATVPIAEAALAAVDDPELHRRAAYALAREPRPEALPTLRRLAADGDPRVRAWAARALGLIGGGDDLPLLAGLLGDADAGPVVQSLRAGGLLAAGEPLATAAAAEAWSPHLHRLLDDPRPQVRLAALEAAAPWVGPAGLADRLAAFTAGAAEGGAPAERIDEGEEGLEAGERPGGREGGGAAGEASGDAGAGGRDAAGQAAAGRPREAGDAAAESAGAGGPPARSLAERAAALVALAQSTTASGAEPARVLALAEAAAGSPQRLLRRAAAAALGSLGGPDLAAAVAAILAGGGAGAAAAPAGAGTPTPALLLATLLADPDPAVRTAALAAVLPNAEPPPAAASLARGALADPDPGVQATALGWLADHPVVPYADLTAATGAALRGGDEDAAIAGIEALAARAEAVAGERGGAIAVIEQLAGHRRWLVRRRAAAALAGLGRPAPPVAGPEPRSLGVYRAIVQRTAAPRTVEVVTGAGTFRLRLDCPAAPLTCHNFLQLAEQGFYDGVAFHRVVADFVVQDGDPRGDGTGGPGWAIRDEINRLRYERGVLGMALSGPDTGGSQWFVTLAPQPHLDGGYTAFGRVVEGEEALDRILPGTAIERVREVP